MDDYVSKPVGQKDLEAMLEKWARPFSREPSKLNPVDSIKSKTVVQEQQPALDEEAFAMLKELGGDEDPEFLESIVEQFIQDTNGRVETIREAAASGDALVLEQSAHSLKSSSASVGALVMSGLCRTLQEMGRNDTVAGSEVLAEQLQGEFERVCQTLNLKVHGTTISGERL